MGLGARFYGLDSLDPTPQDDVAKPAAEASHHGEPESERTGCLGCGAELVYLIQAEPMVCAGCGTRNLSRARCVQGHYYCDRCHSGSAADAIERVCLASSEPDPLALALVAMRHPKVKMHGPEHHFLAPAVLLSAWCNISGQVDRKAALLAEARRRSEPVLGGFCGFQGACGAGVGVGIFVSIARDGSPLKGRERGLSIRATSDAPRCCKRDTFLALLAAARFARKHLGIDFPARGVRCEFHDMNRECTGDACPFHREADEDSQRSPRPSA